MKRLLTLPCCAVVVAAACSGPSGQEQPTSQTVDTPSAPETGPEPPEIPEIEQFMAILSVSDASRAPDGAIYYTTFATGVDQVYRATAFGEPDEQLTHFEDGVDYFYLSPDGAYMAVGNSIGGSEQSDLYLYEVATGEIAPLLVDPDYRFENVLWWPDSRGFYYRSNVANGTDFYLYAYDLAAGESRLWAEAPGWNWLSDVSPDGQRVLVTRYASNADSDVYAYDVDLGPDWTNVDEHHLTPHEGEVAYFSPWFDADGSVWIQSNLDADLLGVGTLIGESGRVTYRVQPPWEVEELYLSEDRSHLAYVTNEDGYGRLHVVRLPDLSPVELPALPDGIVRIAEYRNGHLMLIVSSPTRTGDAWDLDVSAQRAEQVTFSDYVGVDRTLFTEPELVHYTSFDGLEIPAFLYLPPNYQGGIVPTIIDIHGGPESQFRPWFNRHFQYLVLNGFAVFAPNIRGSSGYGPEYMSLDNYRLRPNAIRDIGAGVDWLIEQGVTDSAHLGIKGASYGGYAVMAAISEMPDRFAAASEAVGIVNFVTFLENTADYRRALREAEYGPLSDRAFLESISPIHNVDRIQIPLQVIHGENDPRVPVGEARQVIAALEARGLPVDALIFPDEGHGVHKLENRLVMYRRMVDFFRRHLVEQAP